MTMIIDGTSGVTFPDATVQAAAGNTTPIYRTKVLTSGTTYTLPADTKAIYVFVTGATGGVHNNSSAGGGGAGYSETYYATPAASYSYAIGAAGTAGTAPAASGAGGTTSFGAMSITGAAGIANLQSTGALGGVGSGGTFNASGGAGGAAGSNGSGGGGASGSRAGNGFAGGAGSTTVGSNGGGGGTGGVGGLGNSIPGIAATVKAAGAITLPFTQTTETFSAGNGIEGATSLETMDVFMPYVVFQGTGGGKAFNSATRVGLPGLICILEVLK